MTLALFDLDNTLLDGDSDQLWTEYLGNLGVLDLTIHGPRIADYHEQYLSGELDVAAYLAFSIGLFAHLPVTELRALGRTFLNSVIRPRIRETALALLADHRRHGHRLLIVTLTQRLISGPIAAEFGVDALLATEPECVDGYLTGRVVGVPCYQHGKIAHLESWANAHGESLAGSYFYSDSINDLPLLESVTIPIAVNPDPALDRIARQRGWLRKRLFDRAEAG